MRDLLLKDIGWKIFSLVLAAVLWFIANRILHESAAPTPETSTVPITFGSVPVKIVSAAADVHEFRAAPATVKVTVVGPPAVMSSLSADDLRATVSVAGAGLKQETLLPVDISLPPKVAITGVEPGHVLILPAPKEKQP